MLLKRVLEYNNISEQLDTELATELAKFDGKFIKYRFDISSPNRDPEKGANDLKVFWPSRWTLGPKKFYIKDVDGKNKLIGLAKEPDYVDGQYRETGFKKIFLDNIQEGLYIITPDDPEREEKFAFLELHPINSNGRFRDMSKPAKFQRVDELREASANISSRKKKREALSAATMFTEDEVRNFALAQGWDEFMPIDVLRDQVEQMAENSPETFVQYINEDTYEYEAAIGRGVSNGVISYVQAENKYIWSSSQQLIVAFGRTDQKPQKLFTDWLKTDKRGPETYKRLKAMSAPKMQAHNKG